MSFETAGYQLLPVVPEMVLAVGAMALLMLGAYRGGQGTTALVTGLAVCLLVVVGVLQVTGAWTAAMTWLRIHWISGYELPL